MSHEVIEVTLRVTVDSGYPRENSPLASEIGAFCDRLETLSSVESVEATMEHPIRQARSEAGAATDVSAALRDD
jgi:hypothetical protein